MKHMAIKPHTHTHQMISNHHQPVSESRLSHAIPIAQKIALARRNSSNVTPEPTIFNQSPQTMCLTPLQLHRQLKPAYSHPRNPTQDASIKSVVAHK